MTLRKRSIFRRNRRAISQHNDHSDWMICDLCNGYGFIRDAIDNHSIQCPYCLGTTLLKKGTFQPYSVEIDDQLVGVTLKNDGTNHHSFNRSRQSA